MIPDAGDIMLADLQGEMRSLVLVLSSAQFHRLSERALVAPAGEERPFPWRLSVGGDAFAVDQLKSVSTEHLLEAVGRAPLEITRRAQRAVRLML